MHSEYQQWQEIKANYLKLIEKNLAQIDHPQRSEILANVGEHLDSKYAELSPQQTTWESFQQIITEMGPPEEYAELLTEDNIRKATSTSGLNTFLAIVFIAVLAAVGSYLIYTAKENKGAIADPVIYVNDLPVNGIVIGQPDCTADFVQSLLGPPVRVDSDGKMLRYTDDGFDLWFSGNKHLSEIHLNRGFKGKLDTGITMASSRKDVFSAYGKPLDKIQASDLHRKNDERVLYQKGDISRIYYGQPGLIFWFRADSIIQIVPFKGRMKNPHATVESNAKLFEFEPDDRLLGRWITIDFVKTIDEFDPERKNLTGDLFLDYLDFKDDGKVAWKANGGQERLLEWTKGKVGPLQERPSFYYLRNIDQQTYLFYEWISGDVTERGREPAYYVLKQFKDNESVVPGWFENDPQAIGDWVSVDFVKTIENFDPERQQTSDLFLKTLHFEANGKLRWTVGESKPIGLDWTRGKIRPFDILPSAYSIKPINKTDYLFYEYRTSDRNPVGYYVFKRTLQTDTVEQFKNESFENDPQVLGRWVTVDFVKTPDKFHPGQSSWRGKFWVKELNFQEKGIVEWCLGEDHMKINHHWTKGKLLDDELPANYFIEAYEDSNYFFMEWNSGDVTIRGQKPAYYVLKKAE